MRSTPSMASGSRSSSPTTSWRATAPARSWPSQRTMSATSHSPRSSGSRSAASSRFPATRRPSWMRRTSPIRPERSWSTAVPTAGCRPTRRETDTMDTFVDSSWYWYRYLSPHKADAPFDADLVEGWTPVEQYTGGAEHAVMHLLYAREFTKMMRDVGLIQQNEPWKRLFNQGQILGADGERMSKSRGNTQDPDDLVARYGADSIRLFLMFMGPWDQGGPWSPTGIGGVHRFLNRLWTIALDPQGREPGDPESGTLPAGVDEAAGRVQIRQAAHRTLKVVSGDYT